MKRQQGKHSKPARNSKRVGQDGQGRQGKNTSFKAVSKSAKGKHKTQNQAGVKKHFAKKQQVNRHVAHGKSTEKLSQERQPKKNPQAQPQVESFGVRHLTIEAAFDGQRIDNYLRRILPA